MSTTNQPRFPAAAVRGYSTPGVVGAIHADGMGVASVLYDLPITGVGYDRDVATRDRSRQLAADLPTLLAALAGVTVVR